MLFCQKGRCRISLADKIISSQYVGQIIDLETICFLKADKIRVIFGKQRRKDLLAVLPVIGAVVCQPKAHVEC